MGRRRDVTGVLIGGPGKRRRDPQPKRLRDRHRLGRRCRKPGATRHRHRSHGRRERPAPEHDRLERHRCLARHDDVERVLRGSDSVRRRHQQHHDVRQRDPRSVLHRHPVADLLRPRRGQRHHRERERHDESDGRFPGLVRRQSHRFEDHRDSRRSDQLYRERLDRGDVHARRRGEPKPDDDSRLFNHGKDFVLRSRGVKHRVRAQQHLRDQSRLRD